MSPITTTMRSSSFQSCGISEESYCAPWDLKIQKEKFKLLNEQCQISSSNTSTPLVKNLLHSSNINNQSTSSSLNHNHRNKSLHQTCLAPTSSSSTKKSLIQLDLIPPELPPLPPGGLVPLCQCGINNNIRNKNSIIENLDLSFKKNSHCLNTHTICSGTDTSHSFLFALTSPSNKRSKTINTTTTTDNTQPISFEASLFHFKHLNSSIQNNSLHKIQTTYDQPWDNLQTCFFNNLSLTNNRNGGSLQKMSNTEQTKQYCSSSSSNSLTSTCQHLEDIRKIPIDCYFWYHHAMSRREAENILQSRPSGSFLVRQSESGNHNDYSLSIRTIKGCMHMRICYSEGFYILGECSRPFSSVSCMIKYFSQTSVPIRDAAHIKLGTPVLRWEILTSSSSLSNEALL
ncbi:unnamed protein product [Rotaria sordida]|uniref:SH2 domain-containing protein n=1 Tax=Rotaria sordida TaxID=392033 RepID=A0A814KPV6_9BILA|nr:unnamed protein product [Rotaria sordida]CAF1179439.1 unnamed protein product [Rotaria sordida]CAF3692425.1 unnamed protein product [Rotaria sordida]CAF3767457.1 unnamed protein product [Rotaria sordida]